MIRACPASWSIGVAPGKTLILRSAPSAMAVRRRISRPTVGSPASSSQMTDRVTPTTRDKAAWETPSPSRSSRSSAANLAPSSRASRAASRSMSRRDPAGPSRVDTSSPWSRSDQVPAPSRGRTFASEEQTALTRASTRGSFAASDRIVRPERTIAANSGCCHLGAARFKPFVRQARTCTRATGGQEISQAGIALRERARLAGPASPAPPPASSPRTRPASSDAGPAPQRATPSARRGPGRGTGGPGDRAPGRASARRGWPARPSGAGAAGCRHSGATARPLLSAG